MERIPKNVLKTRQSVFIVLIIGMLALSGVSFADAEDIYIDHESPPWPSEGAATYLLTPHPQYSPDEVIRFQIEALAQNDDPYSDAGIEVAFRFASPSNKEITGPLRRFTRIVYNPLYRPLLNHQIAHYGELRIEEDKAVQLVVLTTLAGDRVSYVFSLSRQQGGHYDNCWMTDSVLFLPGLQDV
jgi:hypothetical protein